MAWEHAGDDVQIRVGDLSDGFFVEDDGSGIPDTVRENLFEPGASAVSGNTGFGLAIVKEIATAHGWTVEAVDAADGGARFEIRGSDARRRRSSVSPPEPESVVAGPHSAAGTGSIPAVRKRLCPRGRTPDRWDCSRASPTPIAG